MSDSTTGPITEHLFPIPESGQCRIEFAWNLFINGRRVARSGDYFPTEEAAEGALQEFLAAAPSAAVMREPDPQ